MILFAAQTVCVMVHNMRRENRARAIRDKIARKDGLREWHIDKISQQIGTTSIGEVSVA